VGGEERGGGGEWQAVTQGNSLEGRGKYERDVPDGDGWIFRGCRKSSPSLNIEVRRWGRSVKRVVQRSGYGKSE